jgi:hypothetical protein
VKRFDILLLFSAIVLSSTVLFQNCAKIRAIQPEEAGQLSQNNAQADNNDPFVGANPTPAPAPAPTPMPIPTPTPGPVMNRLMTLDNPYVPDVNNPLDLTYELAEGKDRVFFETDYNATMTSTQLEIHGVALGVKVTIRSDQCKVTEDMTLTDLETLGMVMSSGSFSFQLQDLAPEDQGCAFPRLTINMVDGTDFDLFMADRRCVPQGGLFQSGDMTIANNLKAYFHGLYDKFCP